MGSIRQSARVGSRSGTRKKPPSTPLLQAIEHRQQDVLSKLLKYSDGLSRADMDDALIKAAARGDLSACRMLVSAGADPNASEDLEKLDDRYACCPAFSASQAQYQDWLEGSTALGGTALHATVEGRNDDVVQLLLQGGSDVNAVDRCGRTPLMLAAMRRGNKDCVRLLLSATGCDLDLFDDRYQRTALHYAAGAGDVEMVKALLQADADTHAKDRDDNTALMLATTPPGYHDPTWPQRDSVGCLKMLLEKGCFINLVNKHNQTALHWAVESRDAAAVETLLNYDAAVHPEILYQACLVHQDCDVLSALINTCCKPDPELYLCVLISLLCQHSSKWNIDNKGEADRSHNVARQLIKGIPNLDIVENLFEKGLTELGVLFQEDNQPESIELILEDLKGMGLLGLALKHGKYGIAWMVYQTGAWMRGMEKLKSFAQQKSFIRHWTLRPWLPSALTNPNSLKMLCRPLVRAHWGCDIAGKTAGMAEEIEEVETFLTMPDLDDIPPFDKAVQDQEEQLLDQCYKERETAKAAYQQTLWLYTDH